MGRSESRTNLDHGDKTGFPSKTSPIRQSDEHRAILGKRRSCAFLAGVSQRVSRRSTEKLHQTLRRVGVAEKQIGECRRVFQTESDGFSDALSFVSFDEGN